jgi:hypothetical protein
LQAVVARVDRGAEAVEHRQGRCADLRVRVARLLGVLEAALEVGDSWVAVLELPDRFARGDGTRGKAHLAQIYWWSVEVGVELRALSNDHALADPCTRP